MGTYFSMLGNVNLLLAVLILLFLCALIFFIYRIRTYNKRHGKKIQKINKSKPILTEDIPEDNISSTLGIGNLKAYVFRDGCLEPTTIQRAIGNVFYADTSMPVSGACYLVRALPGENVEAYDPRATQFKMEESPLMAWLAIHWHDVVGEVFQSVKAWWQSAPLWLTIAVGIGWFIVTLIILG